MRHGGAAWRGWFPLGGELTSGRPDLKEGLYFGSELGADHPAVRAGRPLHGPNLFPTNRPASARRARPGWTPWTDLGAAAAAPRWPSAWGSTPTGSSATVTADPTVLFRIFRYPPTPAARRGAWPSTPTTAC